MPQPHDDQSGVGNGTVTLPRPSRYVDVYYAGPGVLELRSNGELRTVPAGASACEFGAPVSELTLVGAGFWIVHKSASRVTSAVNAAPPTWSLSATSAAAAAQTLTRAAEAGKAHLIHGFEVALGAADTTAAITVLVKLGATTVWRTRFGPTAVRGDRVGIMFPQPLVADVNTPVSLEVSAGSAGVTTDGNLLGATR